MICANVAEQMDCKKFHNALDCCFNATNEEAEPDNPSASLQMVM